MNICIWVWAIVAFLAFSVLLIAQGDADREMPDVPEFTAMLFGSILWPLMLWALLMVAAGSNLQRVARWADNYVERRKVRRREKEERRREAAILQDAQARVEWNQTIADQEALER
jgi:uncharacterized integral membrane protein